MGETCSDDVLEKRTITCTISIYALLANNMPDDTRRHANYTRDDVTVDVARPGIRGMLSVNPHTHCFNIDRSGLRFSCTKDFQPGERLVLDVRAFSIEAHELSAVVTDREELDDGTWCCVARFCFEERHMKNPTVFHALLQIEQKLQSNDEYPWASA